MSERNRKGFVLLVSVVLIAVICSWVSAGPEERSAAEESSVATREQPRMMPSAEGSFYTNAASRDTVDGGHTRAAPSVLAAPSVDQVRQEVAENPHHTPRSIIAYAAELGPKMERALESEEVALAFFEELKTCCLNSTLPVVIQAICLSNAQVLMEAHATLEGPFVSLKGQARAEAVKLITE